MLHECFADEIAIDFPSAGRAVEWMRLSFHGGRLETEPSDTPEIVKTEVSMSPADACRGGFVALDVPLRALCGACGGRGETWAEPCQRCLGTGTILVHRAVRVPVRPGVADGSLIRLRMTSPDSGSVRVEVRVALRPTAV
jgi:hypothetical protein